ncbi:hypothetical protein DL766_008981 [Monosporascus sp. MC13-8B]|uniref:Uncharacterized protein n=1 Tax=Monosporascus cannonballus TaxID=155416 RepID=A0ABY0HLP6_9PEZI|nr:hypothetical protein DL762_000720 [Monosporascus cannonballus]RYO98007.1 hypothetical protein DL763_002512 [Monosporascus cannonballus]RYP17071.1 hypothetical protein DL766_008981 [Monosporascus sp. MC13-8B]
MAGSGSPRTVADATRFTANTPHASAKSSPPSTIAVPGGAPSSSSPAMTQQKQGSSSTHQPQQRRMPPPGMPQKQSQTETIEERVRRLRAAHLAAKQHDISRFDKVVNASRKYFDAAHKFTVMGLIGFSGLALLVTVYATADMMMYNRKRRNEFFALQKQFKEDSLEAARLAYMTGNASEEQIAMVEDATARAKQAGISLPPLLSAPQSPAPAGGWEQAPSSAYANADDGSSGTPRSAWPGEAMVESSTSSASGASEVTKKKGGLTAWLFSGLKKEEARDEPAPLSFGREAAAASARSTTENVTRAVDESQHALRNKAKATYEHERENQRRGGPLDQVGLDAASEAAKGEGKKGWLW